jgi:acetyltransferase EpsM
MAEPTRVVVPLLNPNEPEARVASLRVADRQAVRLGELLCTLETTKSIVDLAAERAAYVVGLRAVEGDMLRAGSVLCWLADEATWQPPVVAAAKPAIESLPKGLRITDPALALARQSGLDLAMLPAGELVTEAIVRQTLASAGAILAAATGPFDPRAVVIYGGGGHGKSLIDFVRTLGLYDLAGVIDDGLPVGSSVLGVEVLGGADVLARQAERGIRMAVNAVGGIGDVMSRVRVFRLIQEAGFTCPTLVHPTAFVETSAHLSPGVQVFPHAYVGSDVHLGFGVIVNTSAVVSHDCQIDDYANVAPGALLAGGVSVGEGALIGMGVTINLGVTVGARARIGNSAVVKGDVPPSGIVHAGSVWPQHDRDDAGSHPHIPRP